MKPLLFLLIGDPFLLEEKRKELLAAFEKEWGPQLASSRLGAEDLSLESVLAAARTLPFLAPAQIFCIGQAEKFKKDQIELWQRYFESPHPQSFFIFEAESLDKNHPFLDWARRFGRLFWLESDARRVVPKFMAEKLKQAGKKITPEARGLLESKVGDSLLFLDSLMDQLVLLSGEKAEIDRAVVEQLEEKFSFYEGWDLVGALGERNLPKALEILEGLLEISGQDVYSLIGLLHWQLRRFWEARKSLSEGRPEQEVLDRLHLSARQAPFFLRELKRFSLADLEKALEGLFHLDWDLKSGRAEGRCDLDRWLVSAIGCR